MHLKFGEITRGNQKIYVQVAASGPLEGLAIHASATTRSGDDVPVTTIMREDGRSFVAILAVFRVGQQLDVALTNAAGAEVAHATRHLTPVAARMRSGINTWRGNATAEEIRCIDDKGDPNGVGLFVSFSEFVYQLSPEQDIVHGTIRVVLPTSCPVTGRPILRFYDQLGINVCDDDWISLGESRRPLFGGSLYEEHTFNFSIRIPVSTRALVCWASVPTAEGPMAHITWLYEDAMALGRQQWGGLTDSAQTSCVYHEWFMQHQRPSDLELQTQRSTRFAIEPTFSLVVPPYDTPSEFLTQMAESVLAQTYNKFELILVNASPNNGTLRAQLTELAQRDPRVIILDLKKGDGIVDNIFAGATKATGDFVALLGQGDVIEPDLLYCYVEGINRHPATDLLYCDEDRLQDGRLVSPLFKPDWDPHLLRSYNYVRHMLTVRRSIAEALSKDEDQLKAFEGAQDHHVALFAGEKARHVYHARKALYHGHIREQPAAIPHRSKAPTEDAGVRAVQAHLNRLGLHATARLSGVSPSSYHVDWQIHDNPLVSIIIPNKDMAPVLDSCITSILEKTTYRNFEIIVVENNSTKDETHEYYASLPSRDERIRVAYQKTDGSFNFSRTINFGVAQSRGAYLMLLNNDTEVIAPDWIQSMLSLAQLPSVGAVGAKLLYPDGLIQHAGVMVHKEHAPFHISVFLPAESHHYHNFAQLTRGFSAVTAACMLVERSAYEDVNGFDESLAVDYNDTDFCLKLREHGLEVVYEPEAVLMHHESISRGEHSTTSQKVDWRRAHGIMMQRWPRFFVEGDPFYNPNLGNSAYYHLEV